MYIRLCEFPFSFGFRRGKEVFQRNRAFIGILLSHGCFDDKMTFYEEVFGVYGFIVLGG